MPNESRTEVVFVDPTVPNYQELLSGMDPNIEVIMLDGGQDGIEQMAGALAGRTGIDAIHMISHGAEGQLQLGTGTLTQETWRGSMPTNSPPSSRRCPSRPISWSMGATLRKENGTASGRICRLTGADVSASTDETGHPLWEETGIWSCNRFS